MCNFFNATLYTDYLGCPQELSKLKTFGVVAQEGVDPSWCVTPYGAVWECMLVRSSSMNHCLIGLTSLFYRLFTSHKFSIYETIHPIPLAFPRSFRQAVFLELQTLR